MSTRQKSFEKQGLQWCQIPLNFEIKLKVNQLIAIAKTQCSKRCLKIHSTWFGLSNISLWRIQKILFSEWDSWKGFPVLHCICKKIRIRILKAFISFSKYVLTEIRKYFGINFSLLTRKEVRKERKGKDMKQKKMRMNAILLSVFNKNTAD